MKLLLSILCLALSIAGSLYAGDYIEKSTPTYEDAAYGPHLLTVLDFWQAEGEGPRPLLVYIHGGGWLQGDKKYLPGSPQKFLQKGISYATINYRLAEQSPLPTPVHDAARAIQFLRSKAADWNINKDRLALAGNSAGACTAMWILLHDDLAEICTRIGLPFDPTALPHTKRSAAGTGYRQHYGEAEARLVGQLCAKEIEAFGYRF